MERHSHVDAADHAWRVRLDSRRRPTLPQDLLDLVGIEPGADLVAQTSEEGVIVLMTHTAAMRHLRALAIDVPSDVSLVSRQQEVEDEATRA